MMNIIAPIALILASVGLFFGYTNPTYTRATGAVSPAEKSIAELQSDEKDYTDALTKTRQIEAARESLLTKFNALKPSDKDKILKLLPDHIDSVRLIIDINNIAAKYGMSLGNLSLSAPATGSTAAAVGSSAARTAGAVPSATSVIGPDNNPYGSVTLGFSVAGSYGNFLQFVKDLEESLRLVDITALSFESSKPPAPVLGAPGAPVKPIATVAPDSYKYSMSIRTYYLK